MSSERNSSRHIPGMPAHTYSIVARDPNTGEMGVAVQSHWFSVGTVVSWGEAGVGVVATQSFANPAFGPDGLELLRKGASAREAAKRLVDADEGQDFRQLAILSRKGEPFAFTGEKCVAEAGHEVGKDCSAQANMMRKSTVWHAMIAAFESTEGILAERMFAALEAAQSEGGDIRGRQSAAMLIVRGEPIGKIWKDRTIDLRVEDSPDPLKELKRLMKVQRAYESMDAGDVFVEKGQMQEAMRSYSEAERLFPQNEETRFWVAVTLANCGKLPEARRRMRAVVRKNADWKILLKRIGKTGVLKVDPESLL
ncbi:MAG TPA: DUF1028 domain-containing protein [Methanomassiliicoccales archaeon]|nr:DUF1028 domain-containing protein [Methanomassiliicoccales archaeon]